VIHPVDNAGVKVFGLLENYRAKHSEEAKNPPEEQEKGRKNVVIWIYWPLTIPWEEEIPHLLQRQSALRDLQLLALLKI
jgi:hypothetical protein